MQEHREDLPDLTSRPRRPLGCYRLGVITCAVVAIGAMLTIVLGMLYIFRHPAAKTMFGNAQLLATCQQQMTMIGQALQRYEIRYDQYPDRLSDLYPSFLSKKDLLKCPADKRDIQVAATDSYTYVKPAPGAPGDTPIVMCNRHLLITGSPPVSLVLQKNGKVTASPGVPAVPSARVGAKEKKK